jgi:hypothetical protein
MNLHNAVQCEETKKLLHAFFSKTTANEISDTLATLLDAHIMHGAFDKTDLANTVNLVNRLTQLAFNLEQLQATKEATTTHRRTLSETITENN